MIFDSIEQAIETTTSHNTKERCACSKKRNYFVTFWNHEYPKELPKGCQYLITCEDETKDGLYHGHAFIYFKNPRAMSAVKKLFGNDCHLKPIFNNSGCIKYVKGEIGDERKVKKNILEYGIQPNDNGCHTVGSLKNTPIEEVPANLYRIKKEIDEELNSKESFFEMLNEIRDKKLKAPEILYITGDSGSGKTYHAYDVATTEFQNEEIGRITIENNFVDIVNSTAKCFVIEEFRDSQMKASSFLQLTDKYGYKCNVKGGFTYIRPEKIIICSIIEPENLYHDEINKQFMRRITDIHRMENHKVVNNVEI